ncbi:S-layer homology domain-containing protein [Brevibacillus sp. NRS-1366]|uniref:S-layer homology domain-containing protein n=1 Tax=Brevibacillus sp. NRS-1366 TaxID=3233899 RepID=UPI003D263DD9
MRSLLKALWTSVLLVGITIGQMGGSQGWIVNKADAAQPVSDYAGHPAKEAIVFGLQKGYIWKYPDGKFYPDQSIVQAQFVASLVAIRGVKEKDPVTELPAGHWAKETYERAQKAGILADVKIDPNKQLTKEEAALLVFNAWKPLRGGKNPNLTNTGALITWGWMKPAPSGQPKFREDLPMLRGDAANILRFLWQDKWQLELGAKYADEFHKSLKVVNGKIVGKVPKGDGNFMIRAMFVTKQSGREGFLNNQSFNILLNNVSSLAFTVINNNDSTDAGIYMYTKLPDLERSFNPQRFHIPRGAK